MTQPQRPLSPDVAPAHSELARAPAPRLHTVKGGGGLELCVAEAGNPKGPAILFVHGFCQSYLSWQQQLRNPTLARDFHLVALDLRGHGSSQKPEGVYTDSRLWADDLHAVLTELKLKRAVLVGWSYGGVVLTDYVRHYGHKHLGGLHFVGALSRVGKPEYYPVDLAPEFLQMLPALLSPDAGGALETFVSMLVDGPIEPGLREAALEYNARVPLHVRAGIAQRSQEADELLRALKLPVLVTHGRSDRVVLPETSRHIASLVEGAELSFYPEVGHSPFWEEEARFNQELAQFVERCQ
jgi:pimeloyl-ACP methyl ester carboxylesterase